MTNLKRAVVVVPTYNEKENVGPLLDRMKTLRCALIDVDLRVLFVDDSSPDGTGEVISELMRSNDFVSLLTRISKQGIGGAYLDGFRSARGSTDPLAFVEMDADLQHPPEDIAKLLDAIWEGADAAVASRYVEGGGQLGWGWTRRLVSRGANKLTRVVLGVEVRDTTSGFRAFNGKAVEAILEAKLPTRGFAFQAATLYLLMKRGLTVVEVPYVFQRRVRGESKLGVWEVLRFFVGVFRMRFTIK